MGIRKEIERLEAEKEGERTDVIKKFNKMVDILNGQARALIYPRFQILQQSGAIEVLSELREETGGKDLSIYVTVEYSGKKPGERFGSQIGSRDFIGEDIKHTGGGNLIYDDYFGYNFPFSHFKVGGEIDKYSLSALRGKLESLCCINNFKIQRCAAVLVLDSYFHRGGYDEPDYREAREIWFESFSGLSPRLKFSGENNLERYGGYKKLPSISIPRYRWGDMKFLEKVVAKAYSDLSF